VGRAHRSYLSVRGGINTPVVLGSRSTYTRGKIGGIEGRQLRSGDIICGFNVQPLETRLKMPEDMIPKFSDGFTVHVVLGPQLEMFTDEGVQTFLSSQYRVTIESDRMGYRLDGPPIEHRGGRSGFRRVATGCCPSSEEWEANRYHEGCPDDGWLLENSRRDNFGLRLTWTGKTERYGKVFGNQIERGA
jgi:allophanate hydrolase subunit 2